MTDAAQPTGAKVNTSLNVLATVLIAGVTATTSVMTLFGLSSDRIWVVLDDDANRFWMLGAGLGAIVSVACALWSYLVASPRVKSWLLFAGTCFYVFGLGTAVAGAWHSADTAARPSIVSFSVNAGETGPVVSFEVAAVAVDNSQRLGVRLHDVSTDEVLVETHPTPTFGEVGFTASLPVRPGSELLLEVWTIDTWGQEPRCPGDETSDGGSTRVEADCATLRAPAGR